MTHKAPVFQDYALYYQALYQDKDYDAEVGYVDGLLTRWGVLGKQVLELGSGNGIHGQHLAKRGYKVHGIERSEAMLGQAQPTQGFTCECGDIRDISLGRSFDVVLALFHVMSYQVQNEDIAAVFERVQEHLNPGGLFIFDVWYSPAVLTQGADVRLKTMSLDTLELSRIAEPHCYPNENRIDVHYTVFVQDRAKQDCRVLKETHAMRHFSLPELDLWASHYGFERVAAEEFLSGQDPSEHTWGVCVVLRKETK
ncbi:MAG: class I SAM-dependent methyltransferase [Candidatus Margulisiibacteriota bacterium]